MGFDITDQLLIRFFAFSKYKNKQWGRTGIHSPYSKQQISIWLDGEYNECTQTFRGGQLMNINENQRKFLCT
jgi:hypothetical protein